MYINFSLITFYIIYHKFLTSLLGLIFSFLYANMVALYVYLNYLYVVYNVIFYVIIYFVVVVGGFLMLKGD